MASVNTLNRAQYSGLDFDTHGDALRSRLQVQFAADFNDFSVSSLGIMLLDLTAYGLDTLSFYLDRRATDTYLATARTRKSVARLARQLGYSPGGAVSSGVDLEVALTEVYGFNVTIPEGFQFSGPNNTVFEAAQAVEFAAGSGPSDVLIVPCFEGETFTETFVSDGTENQVFELRRVPEDKFVVQGTVVVTVDGAEWDYKPLLEYGATDQFEVGFVDDPPTVRFGDGVSGNVPTDGASIDVTYVASFGESGQVTQGTIEEPVTDLVVAFQTIPLTIDNPEASVGGDNFESLTSIKTFAPSVQKSRGVAITGEDYAALGGSYADPLFGRVAVAQAISSRSAATDIALQNLLTTINNAVSGFDADVQTETDNIAAAVAEAGTEATAIDTALTDGTEGVDVKAAAIITEMATVKTTARTIKTDAGEIAVDASDIQSLVIDGNLEVDAYGPSGTGDLTNTQADAIKDFFNRINTEATRIAVNANANVSSADSIVASSDSSDNNADDITTQSSAAQAALASLNLDLGDVTTANGAIVALNTDVQSEVVTATQGIGDHVGSLLAADCKANLVTVPILTRNSAGFYAAPSTGLVDSLQTFLQARKEVTQTVRVTSGAVFLIPAVVSIRVGVLQNFSEAVVSTAVSTAIDGVLRDREFGENLYVSDLKSAVLNVAGVVFTNVTIEGYIDSTGTLNSSKLDANGNLIIESSEVITKSSTTVVPELFESS